MAVSLYEGDYALQQENSKKVVFQLKLTDSSLKAIESLEGNFANGRRMKPTIKFDGSQGAIQIPSIEDNEKQTFTFRISSLSHSSAIDCLQQYDSWNCMGMVSALGEIKQKLTIHANDDTYNATKRRMERVKEQEKNVSTKVIKQPSTSKLPGKKKLLGRQFLEPSGNPSASKSSQSFSRSISPLSSGPDLAGMRNKTKPIISSLPSTKSPSRLLSGKPLQEKVLHYLAIRPIKLHDLITRLARGVTHVDKSKVQSLLNQIASSRQVGPNTLEFSLNKHLFNSVNPDWPGYEDEERVIVKKNIETYRNVDSRKRPILPLHSSPKNSPGSQAALQEETYSNPLKKKARVSLYNKTSPNNPRPPSTSPFRSNTPLGSGTPQSGAVLSSSSVVDLDKLGVNELLPPPHKGATNWSPKSSERKPKQRTDISTPKYLPKEPSDTVTPLESSSTVRTKSNLPRQKQQPVDRHQRVPPSQVFPHSDDVRSDDATIPSPEDANAISIYNDDEFIRKYQPITFAEERDQYKSDFHAEYKEYLTLHQELIYQSKRFAAWEVELKKHEKYTEQYKLIAQTVYDEYRRLKEEGDYMKQRDRFAYLYRKLKHIKNLVLEYDHKQFASRKKGDLMPPLSGPKRTPSSSHSKPSYL